MESGVLAQSSSEISRSEKMMVRRVLLIGLSIRQRDKHYLGGNVLGWEIILKFFLP